MCGMEYRLKKGSVYEGKVEKVDFPNKATEGKSNRQERNSWTDCQILRE